ncbi:head-tail connector protein [Aggregatibacter kilianii]|uniref:head-tail connector protein n=1 Tax=Aggregatibacter kilianii TaxID=2025884 RepID=UPI000DAC24F2|nr:head-tail connector protein [Aggregatibacter kilianii]RDF02324.1 phage gp6-like head-tail connector protein [Aggregatibacter aphrophilus]
MLDINLTIDEIKAHLNLDHDLDDELLEAYKVATLEVCQKHIGKTFGEEETEKTIPFTPAIKIGCLMYIAYLYTNREAVTDLANLKPAPMTISALWEVYREPCAY